MAEGGSYFAGGEGDNVRSFIEHQVGVGRGFINLPTETSTPGPRAVTLGTPIITSTRCVDCAMPSLVEQNPDLDILITQIAEKLGKSITAQLQSDKSAHSANHSDQSPEMTLSNVKLVMQSDAKEPPIFRGDGSDKFTVQEWENLMTLYLRKRAIPSHEQSQEILDRLMGKAGDVVKIKLRNNTSVDHTKNPSLIFDILKQHFSELTYSSMPLADFYNTLPMPNEDAMEYRIRLNKTMDVASECLRKQGRSVGDPSHEISMMFIKHCPDASLAGVFKFKSAEKWSACEIQERLDDHMQEKKTRAAGRPQRPSSVERKILNHCSVDGMHVSTTSALPSSHKTHASTDDDCMRSLVSLLDRLVTQQARESVNPNTKMTAPKSFQRMCRICGTGEHSTLSHCRREDRCLRCLAPGHWKKDCPKQTNQHRSQPTDSNGNNQQLN